MMQRLFSRLYVAFYSLCRLCAGTLLVLLGAGITYGIWYTEPWRKREPVNLDPIVCGKISGEVYAFSRSYFPFWPEYEGKNSFDPDFIHNKKGCDANLVSAFLSMTWPELAPAPDRFVFRQGLEHEGLLVAVSPVTSRPGYLRLELEYLLSKSPQGLVERAVVDPFSTLHWVEGRDALFEEHKKLIYWGGSPEEPSSVGYCSWRPKEPNYFSCKMTFVAFGNVSVEVIMRPDKLVQWLRVRRRVEEFLINSKKKV